jgi:twitching motility protein PilT
VLITTAYIRDCIINPEKTAMVRDAIAAGGSQYGMQTFDQSLFDSWSKGLITLETAMHNASNPDDFKLRTQGITGTSEAMKDEMNELDNAFENF